ncbi:MAG TPA: hypothetical protein VF039_05830 [Longimicrobiales bacterium]
MSETMTLRERIAAARELVRRDAWLAMAAAAVVALCAATLVALLLGGSAAWRAPSPLPLLVDALLITTMAAGALLLRRRWLDVVDDARIAGEAERVAGLPSGAVRGALELSAGLPPGASAALARNAEERASRALAQRDTRSLGGALAHATRRRARRLGGGALIGAFVIAVAGFATPDAPARVRPLLDPIGHLSPPPMPPVRVAPGDASVPRGDSLLVAIDAPLRSAAVVRWWTEGAVESSRRVDLGTGGGGAVSVGPVDARTRYVVETPEGASSDTFTIEPVDPLMLADLTIEARYPAYLERETELFSQPLPALEIPEGTQLHIRARATSTLSSAALVPLAVEALEAGVATGAVLPLTVAGPTIAATWRPTRGGDYAWDIRDATEQPLAVQPAPLTLTIVADSRPGVRVTFPAADTTVPADMRLEILADAADDYGLATAEIVSWRVSSLGRSDEPVRQSVSLGGTPDRALLRAVLDIDGRGMLPGDTMKYLVRVVDNSPRAQAGESRTYALVFPGMSELRSDVVDEAERLVGEAAELARRAEELATETRDASRRMSSESPTRAGRSAQQQSMSFGDADQLQRMAQQETQMLREVEEMTERLESLQRAMESAGLQDPELQRQLDELRDLYESVLTDELREQIEELQRGLEELDPEQVQRALEQLAEQQAQVREQLERSLELFRRAATEQEMSALAQDAREMAGRQEAVADAMADSASAARALAEQRALEAEAEQLEQRLQELGEQLAQMGEEQTAEQVGDAQQQTQGAQQQMQAARQQSQQGRRQQAGQQAQEAAEQMSQAAEQMEQAREDMAQEWREEAAEAVRQATQDVLSLAQDQEALRQRMEEAARPMGMPNSSSSGGRNQGESRSSMRSDQAAIQQGLEALGQNLSEAGQRSAMVSREVGAALGRGMVQMDRVQEQLGEPNAALPVDQARQAVEAMNQLAMELLANADRIDQSEAGTGLQQALEQMAQMAQQQGALNAQANAMMPLALPGAQMQGAAERLAQRQQQIGEGLDQVQREIGDRGDVLGQVDQLAAEAAQIAEQLRRDGVRPETLARQERLFHRMLDAGRTLERDETSEERRAERPEGVAPSRAAPIDASATRGPLYPPPSEAELRRLSPAYRRMILEYFDRLNRSAVER